MINFFNSLFELAVALNFAYVASESIREIFSRGFLSGARNLSLKFDHKIVEIKAKLATTNDSFFPQDKKNVMMEKLEYILEKLKIVDNNLDKKIESAQKIVTNKLKGIYILTAFYSIFMLLLSGIEQQFTNQTSIHIFINELFTINFVTIFIFIIILVISFTKKQLSISYLIIVSLFIMSFSLLYPIPFDKLFTNLNNYYNIGIYSSVILAFSPFILITIRIALTSIYYEILANFTYLVSNLQIYLIKRDLKKLDDAQDIFNKY